MTKLNRRLTRAAMDCPAERVSSGCTSEGYSQARGPHDLQYISSASELCKAV